MKLDRIGLTIVTLALASAIAGPRPLSGQASGTAANWTPSKNAWGHPDIQGIWVASEAAQPAPAPAAPPRPVPAPTGSAAAASPRGGNTGAGPEHWYEAQPLIMTTQLKLVDPPDGKVPALTPDGQQRMTAHRAQIVEERQQHERHVAPAAQHALEIRRQLHHRAHQRVEPFG